MKWYNPADKGKWDKKFRSSKGTDKVDDKYKRGKEAKEHLFKNRNQDRIEINDKKKPFKRGSDGRFQINVVEAEEEHDEWFDIDSLSALAPGTLPVEVPVGNDVDGDLEMELGQGTQPEEVCKIELNLLEQAQKENEQKAQELDRQYKEVMKRQSLIKQATLPTTATPVKSSPPV